MIQEQVLVKGDVERIIEWRSGKVEEKEFQNSILTYGKRALARTLANDIEDTFDFYITRMIFGDGGTVEGVKKFVNTNRNGLFGVTRLSKPVLANIHTSVPTQVIFTSVIKFDEAVGMTLNEMALQMANGNLYSMVTFPDLNKTEDMQITYNWRCNFI